MYDKYMTSRATSSLYYIMSATPIQNVTQICPRCLHQWTPTYWLHNNIIIKLQNHTSTTYICHLVCEKLCINSAGIIQVNDNTLIPLLNCKLYHYNLQQTDAFVSNLQMKSIHHWHIETFIILTLVQRMTLL